MRDPADQVAESVRQFDAAEEKVARQERVVADLQARGEESAKAEALLAILADTRDAAGVNRSLAEAELKLWKKAQRRSG
jgi:hypothetical protein